MIIDANLYWVPEALFTDQKFRDAFLRPVSGSNSGSGYYAYMKTREDGLREFIVEKPQGFQNLNYLQGEYELSVQLADMDAAGVDRAVLKAPCYQEWLDLDLCRRFNDGMAKQAQQSGGRLAALAVIPPFVTSEVCAELDRCMDKLGMHGIQISTHYGDKYLDDPAFAPLFEYLEARQMTAYVHHSPLPVEHQSLLDYTSLRRSYGRCEDQAIAVSRELYSGMFAKYPHVKLVHSMLGGGYFALASLLTPHTPSGEKVNRFANTNEDFSLHLRNNIYFELSHAQPWGKAQLECAVKTVGADHIIFGSSYPVKKQWLTGGADYIRSLDISEGDKELILARNACRLYQL